MMNILYAPIFVRMYKKLPPSLKDEVKEKIFLLKDVKNHDKLKVHKLKGGFKICYSFSVNYQTRIIFQYENKKTINLLYVGAHDELYR